MKTEIHDLKTFFKNLWSLIAPYWGGSEKWIAWTLFLVITVLNLGTVFILVKVNHWYADFYQTLELKDLEGFKKQLLIFSGLAFIYIIFAVYQLYLTQMLQIRWRRWLTSQYFDRWFKNKTYYRLELNQKSGDNPDQRIAQDIQIVTISTLDFFFGFLNAIVTLISFVGILWGISGALEFVIPALGLPVKIPGYMVWAAVIYAILGTGMTHKIGNKLVKINFDLEKFQAHFRYNLVRLRENADSIALYAGEKQEKAFLMDHFQNIWTTWWQLMKTQKNLTWFTSFYSQLAIIFPIVVAAPRFFAGVIHLGILMQIVSAFGQVQTSLSWFITAYPALADWKASVDRLLSFDESLKEEEKRSELENEYGISSGSDLFEVNLENVSLPEGGVLFENLEFEIEKGKHLLVSGPSGCGKSTLFKTLAGIWPYAKGWSKLPKGHVLFLPQKPYLSYDKLEDVIVYPFKGGDYSREKIVEAMKLCKIGHLEESLDKVKNWAQFLSLGEQQRLAFVKVFLSRPDWLFMDESTSALDIETEKYIFEKLRESNSGLTWVTIAHRETLRPYHSQNLQFQPSSSGKPTFKISTI